MAGGGCGFRGDITGGWAGAAGSDYEGAVVRIAKFGDGLVDDIKFVGDDFGQWGPW